MLSAEQYIEDLLGIDEGLERVAASIREHDMPEISIAPAFGKLLTLLVQMSGAKQILEIGALGGYSGICLARGLPEDGALVSLELKQPFADVAKQNLQMAGYGDKVTYMVGEALDSLSALEESGRKFDFFFIDADKGNYPEYLERAIRLANPGAIITGDNTLLRGRAYDAEKNGPSVIAMREFNERMLQDERLTGTMLPAYDGLAIARVK